MSAAEGPDTVPLTQSEMDHCAEVTRSVADDCVRLGRCVFSSADALRQCVHSGDAVDAVVERSWTQHRLFQAEDAPLPPPNHPTPSATGGSTTQEKQSGNVCTTVATTDAANVTAALTRMGLSLLTPVQWTALGVWSWASWAAGGVARITRSAVTAGAATTGAAFVTPQVVQCDGTSGLGAPRAPVLQGAPPKNVEETHCKRNGVIFLPALHGLSLHVVQDLAAHHPYNTIFTLSSLDTYLLERLGVRNGALVTEFLVLHGRLIPADDAETGVRGLFYHDVLNRCDETTVRRLVHWKGLFERVDDIMTRWESKLQDQRELQRAKACDSAEVAALSESIARFKLIHIQMIKLNTDLEASPLSLTLDECNSKWEEMMELFPEVWEMVPAYPFDGKKKSL